MIECKGSWSPSTPDFPAEFECGYEAEFNCDDCIYNGGAMSPVSGKEFRGNRALYEQRPPLEAAKCYSRVAEGDMDFGKLAKIVEDLPCKGIDEDT